MRSIAIQIGADCSDPGGPGPVYPDGSFSYVPPVEENPSVSQPTYRQLGLEDVRPADVADLVAEMNPEFPSIATGERCTYGQIPSEEAHRVQSLNAGDILFFYARLDYRGNRMPTAPSIDTHSGYYLIGQFTLARDPLTVDGPWDIPPTVWEAFATNAHRRRESFDAKVLVIGDAVQSGLYRRVLPLDGPNLNSRECLPAGADDVLSGEDWGRGPVLFGPSVTEQLLRSTSGGRPPLAVT